MAKPDSQVLEEQIRSLRGVLENDASDPGTHFGLGRALARLGRHEEAIAAFEAATRLRSDYTAAWRELGRAHMAAGQLEAGADAFERGLGAAEESGDLQTAREIRVFLRRLGRAPAPTAGANSGADAAATTGPSDDAATPEPEAVDPEVMAEARGVYKQGFAHFARGELTAAIEHYERAIALAPSLSIAWNGLSMALGQAGRLEDAVEAAHQLVALEPQDPLSHTNLSRLLMQQGLIPEAEDARGKAMRLQMKQQGGQA